MQSEIKTIDDARKYLVDMFGYEWKKYIENHLAGDFAWKLARMFEDNAILPRALTAENGAKNLLWGEFHEEFRDMNPAYCGCGDPDNCDFCQEYPGEPEHVTRRIQVTWPTIKEIYKKIVGHYADRWGQ